MGVTVPSNLSQPQAIQTLSSSKDLVAGLSSYRAHVREFFQWLNQPENAHKSASEKTGKFFALLGFAEGSVYSAIHLQHIGSLALRALLEQMAKSGKYAWATPEYAKYIRGKKSKRNGQNPEVQYSDLSTQDLQQLNQVFGSAISIEKSLRAHKMLLEENFINKIASQPNAEARSQGVAKLVDDIFHSYALQRGLQANEIVFFADNHYMVNGTYVLASGLCSTAAFAVQLAKQANIQVAPITERQLILYKDSPNTGDYLQIKGEGQDKILSDGLNAGGKSEEQQIEELMESLKDRIEGLSTSGVDAQEIQKLKTQVDIQFAKRNLTFLIGQCEEVIKASSSPAGTSVRSVWDDMIDAAGGIDKFIQEQVEAERRLLKGQVSSKQSLTSSGSGQSATTFFPGTGAQSVQPVQSSQSANTR